MSAGNNRNRQNRRGGNALGRLIATREGMIVMLVIIGLIIVKVWPGLLGDACQRLAVELSPLIAPLISVAVAVAVLGYIVKAAFK